MRSLTLEMASVNSGCTNIQMSEHYANRLIIKTKKTIWVHSR